MITQPSKTATPPATVIRKTALSLLSDRLNVPAEQLKKTLMATAFSTCRNDDEFISAVIVANEYKLNPFTKEIYAFPSKQGGVIPIVSTDGWNKLMTTHPSYKTHEYAFSDEQETLEGAKPCPAWCEVTITRQDGSQVKVREYLDEVYRPAFQKEGRNVVGPWQTHTKRMLRHKAKIQCAREAFGFGGIYDEDEGKRIIDAEAQVVPQKIKEPEAISQTAAHQDTGVRPEGYKAMIEEFAAIKKEIGEEKYYTVLTWNNLEHANQIKDLETGRKILAEMRMNAK